MKKINIPLIVFFFIIISLSFISSSNLGVEIGNTTSELVSNPDRGVSINTPIEAFNNATGFVNASEFWITNLGNLDNVNNTQFNENSGQLDIDESWLESFGNARWCELTGCTMQGNIDMGGNNITNINLLNATTLLGDGKNIINIGDNATTKTTRNAIYRDAIAGEKCDAVYISGASGDKPEVMLTNNQEHFSSHMWGILAQDATNGDEIFVRLLGDVTKDGNPDECNTTGFTEGCNLHITSTPGKLSCDVQINGSHIHAGIASKINSQTGIVEATPQPYTHDTRGTLENEVILACGGGNFSHIFIQDYNSNVLGTFNCTSNLFNWTGNVTIGGNLNATTYSGGGFGANEIIYSDGTDLQGDPNFEWNGNTLTIFGGDGDEPLRLKHSNSPIIIFQDVSNVQEYFFGIKAGIFRIHDVTHNDEFVRFLSDFGTGGVVLWNQGKANINFSYSGVTTTNLFTIDATTEVLTHKGNIIGEKNLTIGDGDDYGLMDGDWNVTRDTWLGSLVSSITNIIGKLNINGNLNQTNGNATINMIYGEMWMNNDTNHITTPIAVQDTWYNLTGFNSSFNFNIGQTLNGFSFDESDESLVALVSGRYKASFSASVGNAGNNEEYQFAVAINNVIQDNTKLHRKIGAGGDVGDTAISGFIDLNVNDKINIMVNDKDGTADIQTHSANLNLFRIGD